MPHKKTNKIMEEHKNNKYQVTRKGIRMNEPAYPADLIQHRYSSDNKEVPPYFDLSLHCGVIFPQDEGKDGSLGLKLKAE